MHIHPLVTDTDTLARLCTRLKESGRMALDTEFMRENSYYPDLCLVQVASPDDAFIIDPKAKGLDLAPFLELLRQDSLLKIVHAGGQDIEIFVQLMDEVPQPLFDTQVAAMALGLGEQVSYQNLVQHFTGIRIDKGARFTDWARRPLSERQLEYAVGDVTHLSALFPKMLQQLKEKGRGAWLDEEMARLADCAHYRSDPETAWQRLRLPNRKPDVLGRLKALARWREEEAASKDVPRGRIMKDEILAGLATSPPAAQEDLARMRGLSTSWATNAIGQRLMAALATAKPFADDEIPPRDHHGAQTSDASLVASLLKLLLKIRAKEAGVAPRLLARSEELDALAAGQHDHLAMLEGWRRTLFGEDALALVEGRIGFSVSGNKLRMRMLDGGPAQDPVHSQADHPADETQAPAPAPAPAPDGDGPPIARKAP